LIPKMKEPLRGIRFLYNGKRVFPGDKAAGPWRWPPTPMYGRG